MVWDSNLQNPYAKQYLNQQRCNIQLSARGIRGSSIRKPYPVSSSKEAAKPYSVTVSLCP
jgi:hypothetical protein